MCGGASKIGVFRLIAEKGESGLAEEVAGPADALQQQALHLLQRPLLELAHPLLADAEGFAELLQRGAVVGEAPRADDGLLALAQLQQGLPDPLVSGQAVVAGANPVSRPYPTVSQLVPP